MPEKFKRYYLKDRQARSILDVVLKKLGIDLAQMFGGKVNIELGETEFADIYLVNGMPLLAKIGENVFPTLAFNEFLALTPKVVVDMGAVPYVCNGANIMAPGIVHFEGEFAKGDYVIIVDEKHRKPIAIGETIYDTNTAKRVSQGIVVRNVHFVGDGIWNFLKQLGAKASEGRI